MRSTSSRKAMRIGIAIFVSVFVLITDIAGSGFGRSAVYADGEDWSSYQYTGTRSGFNDTDTIINPSSATHLKLHWTYTAAGPISVQPVEANSMIYWGSWHEGLEYASDLKGNIVWSTALGATSDQKCYPAHVGIASTATAATLNGQSLLFVGGGNATVYELNAGTGAILWQTRLGSSPSHFLWSSPAILNDSIYEGVASFGDCPLVQGQMVQLNAVTGAITNVLNTVPDGCTGGGVTSSATIDEVAGTLYFATGNAGPCGVSESYTTAIIELKVSDLSFVGAWQIPPSQRGEDSDFISTPTLFTGSGGTPMVGIANKNGAFYAFQRDALSNGPVWQAQIAVGGDCPQCDEGSISPAAWDGSTLYAAGSKTTIRGKFCKGSVRAINPDTGAFLWQRCFTTGSVLGPVTEVPGVVVVSEGAYVVVLDAASGKTLYRYDDTNSGAMFYGGASIAGGVIYIGNMDGNLFAIGT